MSTGFVSLSRLVIGVGISFASCQAMIGGTVAALDSDIVCRDLSLSPCAAHVESGSTLEVGSLVMSFNLIEVSLIDK